MYMVRDPLEIKKKQNKNETACNSYNITAHCLNPITIQEYGLYKEMNQLDAQIKH